MSKILFWKKEKKLPERKAELPKPVPEVSIGFGNRTPESYPYSSSVKKEIRTSAIRTQNEARNNSVKPLRGMPKNQNHHQSKLWNNRGPIEEKND